MIPVQPLLHKRYFHNKYNSVTHIHPHKFYLSWEDALWDVVRSLDIKKGSIVLVPSFFCVDVTNNMRSHGLDPRYYHLDDNLQPNKHSLLQLIKIEKPAVIVLFHAVGITNICINNKFIQSIPQEIIVIEDCVHRVVNPSKVVLYSQNHLVINSFRKVVPLQGSLLFGSKEFVEKLNGSNKNTLLYSWSVLMLWYLMQLCLKIQKYCQIYTVATVFGRIAEYLMMKGYDIIGDSDTPGGCPEYFKNNYFQLDFEQIKKIKSKQIVEYKNLINKSNLYRIPHFAESDASELRGLPIILDKKDARNLINEMRNKGVLIRAELDESLWTSTKSIIYLPVGVHLERSDITYVSYTFNAALAKTEKRV